MLELRTYSKREISELLNTESTQGIERKLDRYGVEYKKDGRGEHAVFTIQKIENPFKVYCITELNFAAQTDFSKLLIFYYLFFNNEEFATMPAEVKEYLLDMQDSHVSRQTIANYESKLLQADLYYRNDSNCIYYFSYKKEQIFTTNEEYRQAWREYFMNKKNGMEPFEAIMEMVVKHGGVARKQAIMEANAVYLDKIEEFNQIILSQITNEIGGKLSQILNTNII